nr:MAG TPA: hypothetical protein [Caudoviricetes sp.]
MAVKGLQVRILCTAFARKNRALICGEKGKRYCRKIIR